MRHTRCHFRFELFDKYIDEIKIVNATYELNILDQVDLKYSLQFKTKIPVGDWSELGYVIGKHFTRKKDYMGYLFSPYISGCFGEFYWVVIHIQYE